jgi:hypothetical protein
MLPGAARRAAVQAGTSIAPDRCMTIPVQITFHQLSPQPDLADEVRRLAAKLEAIHGGITDCHVVLEVPDRHHHRGRSFQVRIEIGIPGDRVVISHLNDAAGGDENPAAVIRSAFHAAREQLLERGRRHRQAVAPA